MKVEIDSPRYERRLHLDAESCEISPAGHVIVKLPNGLTMAWGVGEWRYVQIKESDGA